MKKINEDKLNRIGEYLRSNKLKLSLVESMPAGFFTSIWSLQTEAGEYLEGSIVCFSEKVKTHVLKVPKNLLDAYSAESMEVTEAMLKSIMDTIPADIHIAITGKAYDVKQTQKNQCETGDVFLSISNKGKIISKKYHFSENNAADVFIRAFNASLDLLESEFELTAKS